MKNYYFGIIPVLILLLSFTSTPHAAVKDHPLLVNTNDSFNIQAVLININTDAETILPFQQTTTQVGENEYQSHFKIILPSLDIEGNSIGKGHNDHTSSAILYVNLNYSLRPFNRILYYKVIKTHGYWELLDPAVSVSSLYLETKYWGVFKPHANPSMGIESIKTPNPYQNTTYQLIPSWNEQWINIEHFQDYYVSGKAILELQRGLSNWTLEIKVMKNDIYEY